MYHFCTYFDRNYLVRGLALYRSLRRHTEQFVLYVLCLDTLTHDVLCKLKLPGVCPIALEEFEAGDNDLLQAKKNRSLVEYYFTCTPALPLYILNNFPDIDVVTYLDADLFFFDNPEPLYEEFGEQSILIVAHRFPDHMRYRECHGLYNVSFLVFRNDEHGRECLNWWRERCLEWCYDRIENGRYADQKYLDDWPERFSRVTVLKHKGGGLAPWNAARYCISEWNGSVLVDSQPLIFYHFHHLQIITSFLFEPGLSKYRAKLGKALKRKIYVPYLREVLDVKRHIASYGGQSFGNSKRFNGRTALRSILRGNILLLIGPISSVIPVKQVLNPLLCLRQYLLHIFDNTSRISRA